MKALSIKQPWAYLIVAGLKDVENRSWKTNFRGRVYVHAGKVRDDVRWEDVCRGRIFDLDIITKAMAGAQVYGAVIGEVTIVDCVRDFRSPWAVPGQYQFVLKDPVQYEKPRLCAGRLGFFEPEFTD